MICITGKGKEKIGEAINPNDDDGVDGFCFIECNDGAFSSAGNGAGVMKM